MGIIFDCYANTFFSFQVFLMHPFDVLIERVAEGEPELSHLPEDAADLIASSYNEIYISSIAPLLASRILFFELRESFLIEYPIAGGRWNRAQRCDAHRHRADGERLSASHWGGSRARALSFEFRLMRIDVAARLIVPVQVNTAQGCACLDRYAFYFSLASRFSDATHGVEKQIARIIGRIRRRYALLTNTVIKFVFPPPVASPSFSQHPLHTLQARARVLSFASLSCDCRRTLCRAKEYLIIEKVKFHK